ncbi:MAG: peptidase S41, partial [Hydrococcus sp. SU_1_0]|nr:peptidase S41 [Hydrococcus sp. SU_1_0]
MNYSSKRVGVIWRSLNLKSYFSRSTKLLMTLAIASTFISQSTSPASALLEDSPKNVVDEVWQIVSSEFVDPDFNHTDWQVQRQE